MRKQTLWIARDKYGGKYRIFNKEPKELSRHGGRWHSRYLHCFCPEKLQANFPVLKLKPGEKKEFTISVKE